MRGRDYRRRMTAKKGRRLKTILTTYVITICILYVHEKKTIAKSFAAELGAIMGIEKMPSEPYIET